MSIAEWLKNVMVSPDAYNPDAILDSFLDEMEKGLNGKPSSLLMLPAYVNTTHQVPQDTPVAVIDAGGTNLRICVARLNANHEAELSDFTKQAMPGRDHEVEPSEFYGVLADALRPFQNDFTRIGFCFSYPAETLPNCDARLLHWTKEIKIPGLVGELIGTGLLAELDARGIAGKRIVVLNDTVATLLAGLATGQTFNASSYVGLILGTGTNIAYVEDNANIGKLAGTLGVGSQVINVESGAFAAFKRGPFDLQLDAESENPNTHVFEKVISGVYMGALALKLLQALATETDHLSESGAAALLELQELSTIHIDNLTADNGRDVGILADAAFSDADRNIMKTVFTGVVQRAALFTAVNLAAAVVKSGAGTDPKRPVCINIDGSTYYKTFQLADTAQAHLKALLAARGLHCRCIQVDDAPVVGAAIAGLTTFD
jgi:hexokinase